MSIFPLIAHVCGLKQTKLVPPEGAACLSLSSHPQFSVLELLRTQAHFKPLSPSDVDIWKADFYLMQGFLPNLCSVALTGVTPSRFFSKLACHVSTWYQIFLRGKKINMSSFFMAEMNSVNETVPSWQIKRNTPAVATKKDWWAQAACNMLI